MIKKHAYFVPSPKDVNPKQLASTPESASKTTTAHMTTNCKQSQMTLHASEFALQELHR